MLILYDFVDLLRGREATTKPFFKQDCLPTGVTWSASRTSLRGRSERSHARSGHCSETGIYIKIQRQLLWIRRLSVWTGTYNSLRPIGSRGERSMTSRHGPATASEASVSPRSLFADDKYHNEKHHSFAMSADNTFPTMPQAGQAVATALVGELPPSSSRTLR